MRLTHWLRPLAACLTRPIRKPRPARRLAVECLEDRSVPAFFTVTTIADGGIGSLRQAILDANAAPGADTIDFALPDGMKEPSGWWTIRRNRPCPPSPTPRPSTAGRRWVRGLALRRRSCSTAVKPVPLMALGSVETTP